MAEFQNMSFKEVEICEKKELKMVWKQKWRTKRHLAYLYALGYMVNEMKYSLDLRELLS